MSYQERALAIIDRLTDSKAINVRERGTLRRAILLPERPQGEWGKWIISEIQCPTCLRYFETDYYTKEELKKCPNCGAGMRNEESPQAEAVSDRYDEVFRDGYAKCINDKEERKENSRLFRKGGAE